MGGSPHDSPAKQLAAMLRSTLRSPSTDGAQPTVGIPETLAGGEADYRVQMPDTRSATRPAVSR